MGQTLDGVICKKRQRPQTSSPLEEKLMSDQDEKNSIIDKDDPKPIENGNYTQVSQPSLQTESISHEQIAEAAERRLKAAQSRGMQIKQQPPPPIQQTYEEPEKIEKNVEPQPQYSAETLAMAAEQRLSALQNKGMNKKSQIEYEFKLAKKEEYDKYERERKGQQYFLTYK